MTPIDLILWSLALIIAVLAGYIVVSVVVIGGKNLADARRDKNNGGN